MAVSEIAEIQSLLPQKPTLSIDDVMLILEVSRPTVFRLLRDGALERLFVGPRSVRITRRSLVRLLTQGYAESVGVTGRLEA